MKIRFQVRFSYEANADRLPTTNLRGRCRPFLAPKSLCFQSPQNEVTNKEEHPITSCNVLVGTNTFEETAVSNINDKRYPE